MSSRLPSRLLVLLLALWRSLTMYGQRRPPSAPQRILIAHHLLLGDTLMLTALLAKLRECYPEADIAMTVRPEFVALYITRPYGVRVLPFDPRCATTVRHLIRKEQGWDLVLIPGDNRYSWLAAALGARWIVAFVGDRPAYKSWPVSELVPFPQTPMTFADMMTLLIEGPAPAPYQSADWPAPSAVLLELPAQPYCVLHVGAGNVLRRWQPAKWRELGQYLATRGLTCIISGAAADNAHVAEIDPENTLRSYAGKTDLPQLWHLLRHARLLVCPDTGIAHLGRIVGVPTVTLFGQGSVALFGAGDFWRRSAYRAVTIPDFPCRDQRVLFKREAPWIRRCSRGPAECTAAECMYAIEVAPVIQAVEQLL